MTSSAPDSPGAPNKAYTPPNGEKAVGGQAPSLSQLRNLLRNEPELWAQHDERNRWFCPHCGEVIAQIVVPAGGGQLLLQDCPHLIREHLIACQAVQLGLPPDKHRNSAGQSGELRSVMHKARMSQRHMLRPIPAVPGFEIGTLFRPMDALAGDFYEFVPLPDGRVGMGVGDPSGHGVEACMLMAVTKKLMSMYGRSGLNPADCLSAMNSELYDDVMEGAFVSALYGILDPVARTFTFARAGHNPPILFNPKREPRMQLLNAGGIALGIDAGTAFQRNIESKSVELNDGDILLLYTDGMTEINDAKGEELGPEGLSGLIAKFAERPIEDLCNQIWYSLEKLFRSTGQMDDMTMLAIRVLPK